MVRYLLSIPSHYLVHAEDMAELFGRLLEAAKAGDEATVCLGC